MNTITIWLEEQTGYWKENMDMNRNKNFDILFCFMKPGFFLYHQHAIPSIEKLHDATQIQFKFKIQHLPNPLKQPEHPGAVAWPKPSPTSLFFPTSILWPSVVLYSHIYCKLLQIIITEKNNYQVFLKILLDDLLVFQGWTNKLPQAGKQLKQQKCIFLW